MSSAGKWSRNDSKWVREVDRGGVSVLKPPDLEDLLSRAREVRKEDTTVAGWIRVLEYAARILVQEQTTRGEILVREVSSLEAADDLLRSRLEIYERMWDGCGCKVDYSADA